MNELLKAATGTRRLQAIVVSWYAPVVAAYFALQIFVVPAVEDTGLVTRIATAAARLDVNQFLFAMVLAFAIAALMCIVRTSLYGVLQGSSWPTPLRRWRIDHAHLPYAQWLRAREASLRAASARQELAPGSIADPSQEREVEVRAGLVLATAKRNEDTAAAALRSRGREAGLLARLPRRLRPLGTKRFVGPDVSDYLKYYPEQECYLEPTQFGNAMAAANTYGVRTYDLDSQTLWYELYSVAPEALQRDVDDAEQVTDTLVAAVFAAVAFTLAAASSAAWHLVDGASPTGPATTTAIGLLVCILLYGAATQSVLGWGETIQALVNSGRTGLADKYGLTIPDHAEEERVMWEALCGFVTYGGETFYSHKLDPYRTPT